MVSRLYVDRVRQREAITQKLIGADIDIRRAPIQKLVDWVEGAIAAAYSAGIREGEHRALANIGTRLGEALATLLQESEE